MCFCCATHSQTFTVTCQHLVKMNWTRPISSCDALPSCLPSRWGEGVGGTTWNGGRGSSCGLTPGPARGRWVRACRVCGRSCCTEPYPLVQMVPKWPLPFAPVVSCCTMSCAGNFFHREDMGANGGTIRHLGTPWVPTNSGVKMH